jgi:hypothetical protein
MVASSGDFVNGASRAAGQESRPTTSATTLGSASRRREKKRRAWNEVADVRAVSYERARDAAFFRDGGVSLDEEVRAAVGDVDGMGLLHLMCGDRRENHLVGPS